MKELYQALAAQIKGAGIKWIDFDSGQLDGSENRAGVALPAALLAFAFTASNVSEVANMQREQVSITVRLAFDATASRTAVDTPASVLNRSLEWLTLADATYAALQGFEPAGFDAMECTLRRQEQRTDGLVVWSMQFNSARWMPWD